MTSNELKDYIFKHNKIEYILENLGCHHIKYNEKGCCWSSCFPDGDNQKGVNIRNCKYLDFYSYSRGINIDDKQDIFNLIQIVKGVKFIDALKYLHKILGLKFTFNHVEQKKNDTPKFDPLSIFKRVKSHRRICNVNDIRFMKEETLHDYHQMIHISLFREGIIKKTIDKFHLCYSYRTKRVCYVHRYWMTGEIMGVNARTMIENYDEFGISKYFITPGMRKDINLYGLWENKTDIEKAGYVVVGESEKSVCKRDSLNDSTWVALSGKSMSEEQVRIILSLDIHEIVIALDEDVREEEVWDICEKFYRIRKVSYIRDSWGLLGKKDSPADLENKRYEFLFKYRTEYDESCHQKYLKSLNR